MYRIHLQIKPSPTLGKLTTNVLGVKLNPGLCLFCRINSSLSDMRSHKSDQSEWVLNKIYFLFPIIPKLGYAKLQDL